MGDSDTFQWEGGPPAPIVGLRTSSITKLHEDVEVLSPSSGNSRDDSDNELNLKCDQPEKLMDKLHLADPTKNPNRQGIAKKKSERRKSHMEPPARERPKNDIWPTREALSFTRSLVFYGEGAVTDEHESACLNVIKCRKLRQKYYAGDATMVNENFKEIVEGGGNLTYTFGKDGIIELHSIECDPNTNTNTTTTTTENLVTVPNIEEFISDYNHFTEICKDGAMRSFCFQRLQMLSTIFKLHITANGLVENEAQSNLLGTDFYRTMKVDNHIHLAAAASAKQFVNFVKNKLETEGDTVVYQKKTLKQVFSDAGLDSDHLTIDAFNVLADYSVYQRFDNFNSKYSPFRMAHMRKIFLKVDNVIQGRFFAELTKNVLASLEASKGHVSAAEMRLSIYGMERYEWLQLANWVLNDWGGTYPGPVLSSRNRWIIQIPRLWRIYCIKGKGEQNKRCFQDMLENIFFPMFEATIFPEKHPKISELLKNVVGFDSVDDEGSSEAPCSTTRPSEWTREDNPSYCWQLYYLWGNLEVLNRLRKAKGLNTFSFRPHAGETGDVMHLAASYMMCKSINHGINLDRQVSLQYLYYLDQVGISVSPLSNNFLFRKIKSNPFPKLFKRGLNVTLSTDDPLLFHLSDDALLEEYSVARASFDLSMTDMAELARNSVMQSCFEDEWKRQWLGDDYKRGITFCDERKTHVPLIRAKFRAEHLGLEHMLVHLLGTGKGENVLKEMMVHFGLARDAHRNTLLQNSPNVPAFPEQNQI